MEKVAVKGLAHITGGGITENIPRVLPQGLDAEIDTATWEQGPVFDFLQEQGLIATDEMRRTFNCGVGMVVVVSEASADAALELLRAQDEHAWRIGRIVPGDQAVQYV